MLVVIRKAGKDGKFADVKLACAAAPIARWTPLATGLEFARVDLGKLHVGSPRGEHGAGGDHSLIALQASVTDRGAGCVVTSRW